MKKKNIIFGIALMILATAAIVESLRLPLGVLGAPRTGFWPLLLGITLVFLSIIYLSVNAKRKDDSDLERSSRISSKKEGKIILIVGVLFAFAFFFESLGHLISVFLLAGFLLQVIVRMKWWLLITVAVLSSILSYVLLHTLLGAPLPAGLLKL